MSRWACALYADDIAGFCDSAVSTVFGFADAMVANLEFDIGLSVGGEAVMVEEDSDGFVDRIVEGTYEGHMTSSSGGGNMSMGSAGGRPGHATWEATKLDYNTDVSSDDCIARRPRAVSHVLHEGKRRARARSLSQDARRLGKLVVEREVPSKGPSMGAQGVHYKDFEPETRGAGPRAMFVVTENASGPPDCNHRGRSKTRGPLTTRGDGMWIHHDDMRDERAAMKLVCAGMTDVGNVREHNEDDFYVSEGEEALCIVADGMGGHRSGEVASALAIKAIVEYYRETMADYHEAEQSNDASPEQHRLTQAVKTANRAVFAAASSNESYRNMGTTIVGGFFTERGVYLAHIGDSRCYRLRGGDLEQRTDDHSLANEYVRMGILSAEDVEYFPYKNVITRACGLTDEVEVDVHYEVLEPGDVYLFCSDGLSDMVSDAEVNVIMNDCDELDEMCRELVERANANGGADNITVVLARIEAKRPPLF